MRFPRGGKKNASRKRGASTRLFSTGARRKGNTLSRQRGKEKKVHFAWLATQGDETLAAKDLIHTRKKQKAMKIFFPTE